MVGFVFMADSLVCIKIFAESIIVWQSLLLIYCVETKEVVIQRRIVMEKVRNFMVYDVVLNYAQRAGLCAAWVFVAVSAHTTM